MGEQTNLLYATTLLQKITFDILIMRGTFATLPALFLVCLCGSSHLLTGALAFSATTILNKQRTLLYQQQIISWQLRAVYDDNNDESPNNAAIIPAGEEALHSARMARSIRQFRTTRGRVNENEKTNMEEKDEESIMDSRGSLLTKTPGKSKITTQKKNMKTSNKSHKNQAKRRTNFKLKINSDVETGFVDERPKRSNGIDLPYQSTIEALREYYKINGDLVMPRRYHVPEDEGMCQGYLDVCAHLSLSS